MGKLGGKERQRRGESMEIGTLIAKGNCEGEGVTPSFGLASLNTQSVVL